MERGPTWKIVQQAEHCYYLIGRQDPAQEGETSLPGRWAAREGQTDHHGQGQVDPNSDEVEVKV